MQVYRDRWYFRQFIGTATATATASEIKSVLVQRIVEQLGLAHSETPSTQEAHALVKFKSPGSNGVTSEFLSSCSEIIKLDILDFSDRFYRGSQDICRLSYVPYWNTYQAIGK